VGREYEGEYICDFTTRPGTPESKKNPTTHLTFSYATQVVILDEEGRLERVVAAHDVGHALNPRMCAEQMEGGVHMGLGYALSEKFASTDGRPDSLLMRDFGIVRAKDTPRIDVILIEEPDEIGGYGSKGVGEIGCVATAPAVAAALHSYDGIRWTMHRRRSLRFRSRGGRRFPYPPEIDKRLKLSLRAVRNRKLVPIFEKTDSPFCAGLKPFVDGRGFGLPFPRATRGWRCEFP
jgi:hypothetical protein